MLTYPVQSHLAAGTILKFSRNLINGKSIVDSFHRVKIVKQLLSDLSPNGDSIPSREQESLLKQHCHACGEMHVTGYCPLKLTGVEHCGLCGLAHFGASDSCPHLMSEGQVRLMLDALKASNEPKEIIDMARAQLRSRIHKLVENKKRQRGSLGPINSASHLQPQESNATSSHAT